MRFDQVVPDAPDIPDEFDFLWGVFWDINNNRSSNGFSLNPVSWLELEAWQRGTVEYLTRDEARIIMALFRVHDRAMTESTPKPADD